MGCQTHWLGGMGIVALTLHCFRYLGVGGIPTYQKQNTALTKTSPNTAREVGII